MHRWLVALVSAVAIAWSPWTSAQAAQEAVAVATTETVYLSLSGLT